MNWNFNLLILVLAFTSLLCTAGCKGNSSSGSTSDTDGGAPDSAGQSLQGGMNTKYRMKIEAIPDMIEAGKEVMISFTPQIVGREAVPVPLDVDRGYEIHLIMVNDDLSWFDHRHPGLSDLGSYKQAYTFDKGGIYYLYADYKPTGAKDTFQMQSVAVSGSSVRAYKYDEEKLTSTAGPFEVKISVLPGSSFESGRMQQISAIITKGGTPVDPNTLGDYLGGKGHLVIIGLKDKNYLHVHPAVENGKFIFHTNFSNPGFYRAWLQFQTENIVQTADFVFNIQEGKASTDDTERETHTEQH